MELWPAAAILSYVVQHGEIEGHFFLFEDGQGADKGEVCHGSEEGIDDNDAGLLRISAEYRTPS